MEDERICTMCGCILQEHEQTEIDDEWICDSCAQEHTTTCDHCGETIWSNDSVYDGRTTLCESCFDDHYRRCEDCGRILHDDDVLWYHDLPYCANCYARTELALAHNGVLYNDELLRSKTAGRQFIPYIVSITPDKPEISNETYIQVGNQIAQIHNDFQCCYALHLDAKTRHLHFLMNAVSFRDGHKYSQSRADLGIFRQKGK